MPFHELLTHLTLTGDSIHWRADGKLTTERGHKYVESNEGQEYYNGRWSKKTIWSRV